MKTVYLVQHKRLSYGEERKILRAYEDESDAKDFVKLTEGIITGGGLEIVPLELAPAAGTREIVFSLRSLGRLGPELPNDDEPLEVPQPPLRDFVQGDEPLGDDPNASLVVSGAGP